MSAVGVDKWLYPTECGLFCEPGGFHIDPVRAVDRAVVTHAHSDHARAGHGAVLATTETIAFMRERMGAGSAGSFQSLGLGSQVSIGGVNVRLAPAGHILGSAQVVLEWNGQRAVVSGDYKRAPDPTCAPFEVVPCDVFVTEATFALPVFQHEPAEREARRLLESVRAHPERTHLVGVYSLGKCQRLIKLMRLAGYEETIYLHGALRGMTAIYERLGVALGPVMGVSDTGKADLAGALVLCPPSALADRWANRFADPLRVFASGWMRVKGRIRQRNVELPLVISDHADWRELIDTIVETGAEDVWVTHGRDDALVYQLEKMGRKARALSLVGFEDEAE